VADLLLRRHRCWYLRNLEGPCDNKDAYVPGTLVSHFDNGDGLPTIGIIISVESPAAVVVEPDPRSLIETLLDRVVLVAWAMAPRRVVENL